MKTAFTAALSGTLLATAVGGYFLTKNDDFECKGDNERTASVETSMFGIGSETYLKRSINIEDDIVKYKTRVDSDFHDAAVDAAQGYCNGQEFHMTEVGTIWTFDQ